MHEIVDFLVQTIGDMGYIGIFLLMFLESSFFPFPSEVVMIPAGYLAFQGEMNFIVVVVVGIIGSLSGAWFNYFLAQKLGRKFILKVMSEEKLQYIENYFKSHGAISTFNGRLIPGIRQYISFPAGLANMDSKKFTLYTALGAGIWVFVLTYLGYVLGDNEELIKEYLHEITLITLALIVLLSIGYYVFKVRPKKAQ